MLASRRRQSALEQLLHFRKRCALGHSCAGPHAQPFSVVEPRSVRVSCYTIQQGDSLVVSLSLHEDIGFADPKIGSPDPCLHPLADFPAAPQSCQTLVHFAGSGGSPAKQPFSEAFPVENMMPIHDLDELFTE